MSPSVGLAGGCRELTLGDRNSPQRPRGRFFNVIWSTWPFLEESTPRYRNAQVSPAQSQPARFSSSCPRSAAALSAGQLRRRAARPDLRFQRGELAFHVGICASLIEFLLDVVGIPAHVLAHTGLDE